MTKRFFYIITSFFTFTYPTEYVGRLCRCLCCFITLWYLEFVMKQDTQILSLQGLFNPAPLVRTVIRISLRGKQTIMNYV